MPPVIIQSSPGRITVFKIKSTVKLSCTASGSPAPVIEWSKNGRPLSVNTTVRQSDVETTGELVIEPFMPQDQGQYKCFFKNYDNGTAETSIQVGKWDTEFCKTVQSNFADFDNRGLPLNRWLKGGRYYLVAR